MLTKQSSDDIIIKLFYSKNADMAESADALDSGSSRGNSVEVQVLLSAPKFEFLLSGTIKPFLGIRFLLFVTIFHLIKSRFLRHSNESSNENLKL